MLLVRQYHFLRRPKIIDRNLTGAEINIDSHDADGNPMDDIFPPIPFIRSPEGRLLEGYQNQRVQTTGIVDHC